MNFKSVQPDNKEHWLSLRTKVITSTEVSALFNLNPYQTLFETWHRKKAGSVISIEENERMKWGTYLQPSIANGIATDEGWQIREKAEFIYNDDGFGSSFDYEITSPINGLLEIKNVDSRVHYKEWKPEEAPPHIELQVQYQLMIAGLSTAYIGALVGGNEKVLLKRTASKHIQEMIVNKVIWFWDTIKKGQEPVPNFKKDAAFIASLYNYADPNSIAAVDENHEVTKFCNEYKDLQKQEKEISEKKEILKAKILTEMKDCEKIKGPNFSVSAGMIGEAHVNYVRKPYRNFKITFKKGEADE